MKYNVPVDGKHIPLIAEKNEDGSLQVTKQDWDNFNDKVAEVLAPNSMSFSEFMQATIDALEEEDEE